LVFLALHPQLVIALREADAFQVVGAVGIATDVDHQGPLTWFLRTSTYSILAVAVLAAAALGLVAVIRAPGRPGVRSLAAFLAGSALGLCLLYVVVLFLPEADAEKAPAWLTLVEATGTEARGRRPCSSGRPS
jgi:hypothetical protein